MIDALIGWAQQHEARYMHLVITDQAQQEQQLSTFYARLGFQKLARTTMLKPL